VKQVTHDKDGFIVAMWDAVFGVLEKVSLFFWLRRFLGRSASYSFVEGWVLGHCVGSFAATLVAFYLGAGFVPVLYFILFYGLLRVFEIVVYQLNMLLFHPHRA